uniref:tyrosine--tRNA ligase n=1 Tax=Lygus hesperus TaxID=30085 RepID=A0A0A9WRR6_LYGHE
MLYPLLQALDEEYLHCDVQFGGVDQRKIFTYAETYLPKLNYRKRVHLMNPMIPSFAGSRGNKMSSSELDSKIDFLESSESVTSKVLRAYAPPGDVDGNGLLAFTRYVIFPLLLHIQPDNPVLCIGREERFGGPITFASYEELEQAYKQQHLYPLDLKNTVACIINQILDKVRADFSTPQAQALLQAAYPYGDGTFEAAAPVVPEQSSHDNCKATGDAGGDTVDTTTTVPAAPPSNSDIYKLDICVGECVEVVDHPQADSLYVCQVDIGTGTP